jgi:hypothetical protein
VKGAPAPAREEDRRGRLEDRAGEEGEKRWRRRRRRFLRKGNEESRGEGGTDSGAHEVDADVEGSGDLAAEFGRLVHPTEPFFEGEG